jgi:Flp pilus assembly protein CpaB
MNSTALIVAVIALLLGAAAGYLVRRFWAGKQLASFEAKIEKDIHDSE